MYPTKVTEEVTGWWNKKIGGDTKKMNRKTIFSLMIYHVQRQMVVVGGSMSWSIVTHGLTELR